MATEILQTKLYPPRIHEIVSREKLLDRLGAASSARLATIVTGAGYGKSTLAAEFITRTRASHFWYNLEDSDCDLSVFMTYLAMGFNAIHAECGIKTLRRLESADNVIAESRQILSCLISEMADHIKKDAFVVLDDYHTVNESVFVNNALHFLLEHIPPNIHFFILSRSRLNLDLSRLLAQRELLEIKEGDLCFSCEEASRLFSQVFGMPLKDEDIRTVTEMTEGWISGMLLFYLALKDRERIHIEAAIEDFKAPDAQVSSYLSRAVYGKQNREVKDFLLEASVLPRMNPAFCDELLGIDNSGEILSYLTDERFFTIPLDDRGDWYRFHHLLRSYLSQLLRERGSEREIDELHRKAAALWEKHNEPEQALSHYLEANEYEKAAGILEGTAQKLLETHRVTFLHDHLGMLPQDVMRKIPWLVFCYAETSDILGRYDDALGLYLDAISLFEEQGSVELQVLSLLLAARLLNDMGRYEGAREMIGKAREITPEGSPYWHVLTAFKSVTSTLTGISDLAQECLMDALAHCGEIADEATRASLLYWCGFSAFLQCEYRSARQIMLEACELAERHGLSAILLQLYVFLSQTDLLLGRLEEAVEYAERGISLGEEFGADTPSAFSCRANRAAALAPLGDHKTALRDAAIAGTLAEKYGASLETFNAELTVGWTHQICGDRNLALKHFKRAEHISSDREQRELKDFSRAVVMYASLDELGAEALKKELEATIESCEGKPAGFDIIYAHHLLALIELTAGDKKAVLKALDAVSELDQRYGGFGWWKAMWSSEVYQRESIENVLELADEIFGEGRHFDHLGFIYESAGSASLPHLHKLVRSENHEVKKRAQELIDTITREAAEPLQIRMLGPFEVEKGEERIPPESWKSRKALSILKYLAAQREGALIPKDVLMELVWPYSPPASASKNLNMALSSLRKTLEPEAGRGQSSYLVTSGDTLLLNLGKGGWVDFKLFRNKLSEGRDARMLGDRDLYLTRFCEADELYRGDFLEEDLYEDWCCGERERLQEERLSLLSDICEEHLRRGRTDEALLYSERAIQFDSGREGLYRGRMEIYSRLGDRSGIERTYRRCCSYLKDTYDVSPSPETEKLYHSLRGS
jgi:LuxR family maltose regulon positive regulatory protein